MCKVCEIRAKLEAAGVATEVIEAVANDATVIADTLGVAVDVLNNIRERAPGVMTDAEFAQVDEALQKVAPRTMPGGGLAALLAAVLGGGVSVEVMHVTPNEGESPDEAMRRALAERETGNVTKH